MKILFLVLNKQKETGDKNMRKQRTFVSGRLFLEIEQNVNIAQYLSFKPKT